jgi:predicted transport protein
MPRGPEQMMEGIVRNLPERTGRSLQQWIALLDEELPGAPFKQRHEYLIAEHGLGRGQARTIVHLAAYESRPPEEEMVAAQYAGAKAGLRPVYDAVVDTVAALGDDVEISPRKTYVTISRARQFAVVQASTRDRVDLGARLDATAPTERLQAAGSFGSGTITHRVGLGSVADVDDEVRGWLRQAYEAAAPQD